MSIAIAPPRLTFNLSRGLWVMPVLVAVACGAYLPLPSSSGMRLGWETSTGSEDGSTPVPPNNPVEFPNTMGTWGHPFIQANGGDPTVGNSTASGAVDQQAIGTVIGLILALLLTLVVTYFKCVVFVNQSGPECEFEASPTPMGLADSKAQTASREPLMASDGQLNASGSVFETTIGSSGFVPKYQITSDDEHDPFEKE
ncbi:uncharacterized protein BJ171DRAFT_564192 [Polychytrium aggregatum]|uniref:uncharacterized protein n=1 Tax=Polychytrium aggregatum TaxID=110093 RepID=UPI0022FE842C|nr:uncharacterized protein BJ171DRAFT_564192 [Polychytrium aggregatum]KAI9209659.1 hypothetical protein BJ171DRAFT_564192 [Polychytrium aggregatum]